MTFTLDDGRISGMKKRGEKFGPRYTVISKLYENKAKLESLAQLPASCSESADQLSAHRSIFEAHGVFNPDMIDDIVKHLKSFDDADIRKKIEKKPELMLQIVHEYFYCG